MGVMIQFYFEYIDQNVYPISNTEGGLIIAAFFAAELIGAPLFGAWSDRYGRKLFIILGPLFGALAVQMTAMTTLVWILIITRLLEGLSTASNAPATLGYISAATSGSSSLRGRVVGFFELATVGGMAAGLWLGGVLWESWGRPAHRGLHPPDQPGLCPRRPHLHLLSLVILAWGLHETHMTVAAHSAADSGVQAIRTPGALLAIGRRRAGCWRFVPAWLAINAVLGVWLNHVARQLTRSARLSGPDPHRRSARRPGRNGLCRLRRSVRRRHPGVGAVSRPPAQDIGHAGRHWRPARGRSGTAASQSPAVVCCPPGRASGPALRRRPRRA